MNDTPTDIAWLDAPIADGYGTVTLGRWGGWLIQICPMLFNDRLVLTPESCPQVYDYGWCYPKGGAAHLAVLAWSPASEGEPSGFIKAVNTTARQPGEMARGQENLLVNDLEGEL